MGATPQIVRFRSLISFRGSSSWGDRANKKSCPIRNTAQRYNIFAHFNTKCSVFFQKKMKFVCCSTDQTDEFGWIEGMVCPAMMSRSAKRGYLHRKVGTLSAKTWQHSRTEAIRRGRKKPKHDAEATNRAWETVGNGQYFIADRAVLKLYWYDLSTDRIGLKLYGNNSIASRNLTKPHEAYFMPSRSFIKSMREFMA